MLGPFEAAAITNLKTPWFCFALQTLSLTIIMSDVSMRSDNVRSFSAIPSLNSISRRPSKNSTTMSSSSSVPGWLGKEVGEVQAQPFGPQDQAFHYLTKPKMKCPWEIKRDQVSTFPFPLLGRYTWRDSTLGETLS